MSSKSRNVGWNTPDSLIAPNSVVRGVGGSEPNEKKGGITINNKSSAENGIKRMDNSAAGWGSNSNGQYDPVPPGVPNY